MKRIYLSVLVVLVTLLSCNKDDASENSKIKAKDLEFIGVKHNLIMASSLEFLEKESKNKDYSLKTQSERIEDLQNFVISETVSNEYSKESNEQAIKNIKNIFQAKKYYTEENLSEIEQNYLDRLYQIIEEANFDIENDLTISRIEALETEIENISDTLTDEQLVLLFSATQTGKYSYDYWKNNIDDWLNSDLSNMQNRCGSSDCPLQNGVVQQDIGGAVAGAVSAWIANAIPGVGQVAYGSTILGAAAAASVKEIVTQALENLGGNDNAE